MTNIGKKLALCALSTLALGAPGAFASGMIDVYNESPVTIQPYFKSNCWGWAVAQTDAWVFFGNIGGNGGRFGWDFSDPALTDPSCQHPVIQFTYGTNNVAPPDPQQGVRRGAVQFSPDTNTVFQIGKSLYAKELAAPDENAR